jgi:hypothetical protein
VGELRVRPGTDVYEDGVGSCRAEREMYATGWAGVVDERKLVLVAHRVAWWRDPPFPTKSGYQPRL